LALLAVSLLPLMVAGAVAYRAAERAMKDEVLAGLSALSASTFEHFVDYVDEKEAIVTLLAQTPTVINAMGWFEWASNQEDIDQDYASLDVQYRPLLELYSGSDFNGIYLITTSGDIVFSLTRKEDIGQNLLSGAYKDTELAVVFKRVSMSSKTELSEFKVFPFTKEPAAFIASPLWAGKRVLGFVAFKLDTPGLYKHVKDYTGLGRTGEICLGTRRNGHILFVAPLRHDPEAAFRRRVPLGSPLATSLQRATNKESGSGIVLDYRGKKTVAVWRYFEPLDLGFVVKQDVAEAFASIWAIRKWAFIIGGFTLIFVMLVSAFVAKSIARPIKKLQMGVARIGAGDFSQMVGTDSNDEIGRLSRAVDEMTRNLSRITASRDELDREIEERKRAERGMRESQERLREYSKDLEVMVERRSAALRDVQRQLIQKEKLAAIGQLSSSVGHELRNPLGVIGNSLYYLRMKLKDRQNNDNIAKHLDIMAREIRRSNRIISDLLDFSRASAPQLRQGSINTLIRDTILDMRSGGNVTVDMDLSKDIPPFPFDPDQIRRVILNLVTNAYQARPSSGKLYIVTGVQDGFAMISFKDTGEGLRTEDLPRIFEPLYTTRAVGTGLGLSIVKGIVERHGGYVSVESKVGEGSVFTVKLPVEKKEI